MEKIQHMMNQGEIDYEKIENEKEPRRQGGVNVVTIVKCEKDDDEEDNESQEDLTVGSPSSQGPFEVFLGISYK